MTQEELNSILRLHKARLIGKFEGKKADLHGVNLHGADLQDDDLRYVDFQDAILCHVDLWFADLHGVDLRRIADRFIRMRRNPPASAVGSCQVGEKCYGLPNGTTLCADCCKPENDSGIDKEGEGEDK